MTHIKLTTQIDADIKTCFDMVRDIDMHTRSTHKTNERVIAGRTSGLCEQGDTITWEATHFGIRQQLTVKIVRVEAPYVFEDTMIKGAFKSMHHVHRFKTEKGKTIITDDFHYEVPFGFLGKIFDKLILKNYMTRFLKERNQVLKEFLEK